MKVLLVKPPVRSFEGTIRSGRDFPIGLAYLSAQLKRAGHEVRLFDALAHGDEASVIGEDDYISELEREKVRRHPRPGRFLIHYGCDWDRIEDVIRETRPDVVGISSMFSAYHLSGQQIARIARRVVPKARVLMGGAHPTAMPERVLRDRNVDVIAVGEAEDTVVELLEHLEQGRPLDAVTGIAFRCGEDLCHCAGSEGTVHLNPRRAWNFDLDGLPHPDVSDIRWDLYEHRAAVITSRGCPLSCSFCSVHGMVGKKHRARSPANVVDELEWYAKEVGVRAFNIEDDNFTWDPKRVEAICREVMDRGLDIELRLPNGITVINLADELAATMCEAGFTGLFLGLESTDPAILRKIKKGFTSLEKVVEGTNRFKRHHSGIKAIGALIIGLPDQGIRSVARDITNLLSHGVGFFTTPFYPVPGSPDRERAIRQGILDPDEDPALVEPYCYHDGFAIDSERLYWSYQASRALSVAGRAIVWSTRRARGRGYPTLAACLRLLRVTGEWQRRRGSALRRLPVLLAGVAAAVGFEWSRRAGGEDGGEETPFRVPLALLSKRRRPARSDGSVCQHADYADELAAALTLLCGRAIGVSETRCAAGSAGTDCEFVCAEGRLSSEAREVLAIFAEAIEEVTDGPRPRAASTELPAAT